MYEIIHTKGFKKSLRKLQKSGKFSDQIRKKLTFALDILISGDALPPTYRDHALKGGKKDKRECHIKGDLVLVYKKQDDVLVVIMVDIGTHSQVFG